MNRRDLMKGMMALPFISSISSCKSTGVSTPDPAPTPSKAGGTLRIFLNGAFGVLIQRNNFFRVRAFSPRDPAHGFFFNEAETRSSLTNHHFELLPDGIEFKREAPEIDPALSDFRFNAKTWCQDDYFVTVDLPAPRRITFIGPLTPVRFSATCKAANMASNFVLEYPITDSEAIKGLYQEIGGETPSKIETVKPLSRTDVERRYPRLYQNPKKQNPKNEKPYASVGGNDARLSLASYEESRFIEVQDMKEHAEQWPSDTWSELDRTFLFGLGPTQPNPNHAVEFFNNKLLMSFP